MNVRSIAGLLLAVSLAGSASRREQLKIDAGMSDDFNTLGLAEPQLGKYDESVAHYQQALQLDRAHHDLEGEAIRENNIGNVCFFVGSTSMPWLPKHRPNGEILALRDMGIVRAMDLDDLEGALEALGSALALARRSSDTLGIVQAALYRGEVYRRMKRLGEAQSDFQLAIEGALKAKPASNTSRRSHLLAKDCPRQNQFRPTLSRRRFATPPKSSRKPLTNYWLSSSSTTTPVYLPTPCQPCEQMRNCWRPLRRISATETPRRRSLRRARIGGIQPVAGRPPRRSHSRSAAQSRPANRVDPNRQLRKRAPAMRPTQRILLAQKSPSPRIPSAPTERPDVALSQITTFFAGLGVSASLR